MKAWIAQKLKALLDSAVFKNIVVESVVRSFGVTSGFLGWLYKRIASWVFEFLRKYARREVIKVETEEQVKTDLEEYKNEINKPDATPEDIRKAGTDFWTS